MDSKTVDGVLTELSEECKNAVAAFKRELQKVRTGRASAGLIEGVMVEHYGSKMQLSHLGQISTPEPRLILINVFDSSAASAVEKAIQSAGLGFNPSREGNSIRIVLQPLTQEARKDIVRHLHKMTEEMRVSVRNHRRDANDLAKRLEKDGDFTKDDTKRCQERVQKQVDSTIQEIDKLLAAKEAEIMEV